MTNYSKYYRIIPLSKEILNDAISLIENVFHYKPDQKLAKRSFTNSLSNPNSGEKYWLAVNKEGKIVGITGLYDDNKDCNVVWLGWFGVHMQHRQNGIGSMLLEFSIYEAIEQGFSILKLYSSFDKHERAAHQLYKRHGFLKLAADKKNDRIYFKKYLTKPSKNMEDRMKAYELKIEWEGPLTLDQVIKEKSDGGDKFNKWEGNDYGLYQIYGRHILYKQNALLYVGIATESTFSQRFKDHEKWLCDDQDTQDIKIFLGRIYNSNKLTVKTWTRDVKLAEKILIYKYTPNYNGRQLSKEPYLYRYENIRLIHIGQRNRLKKEDNIPKDFREW